MTALILILIVLLLGWGIASQIAVGGNALTTAEQWKRPIPPRNKEVA